MGRRSLILFAGLSVILAGCAVAPPTATVADLQHPLCHGTSCPTPPPAPTASASATAPPTANPTAVPTRTPTSQATATLTGAATSAASNRHKPRPRATPPPTPGPPPPPGPGTQTAWHYTANGNFPNGTYAPGADGFNLADVSSASAASALPSGVKGLVWLSRCHGADAGFTTSLSSFVGNIKVFGFYLMDEPTPSSCPAANLMAESDWIHAHVPGTKTFIVLMNMSSTDSPTYQNTYRPANTHIDLFGLDPYPCRTELGNSCAYSWIPLAVSAAEASGVPLSAIVPVYQAFGGGAWADDGGGHYLMPSAAEEATILQTWSRVVPSAAFDYAYSWGSQNGDTSLSQSPSVEQVFASRNAR